MPKIYVLDFGIRNYLLRSFNFDNLNNSAVIGSIMENFVYLTLLTKNPKEYIHFYRTIAGSEIDFIIEKKWEEYCLRGKI